MFNFKSKENAAKVLEKFTALLTKKLPVCPELFFNPEMPDD
jgi:hypothetical protein